MARVTNVSILRSCQSLPIKAARLAQQISAAAAAACTAVFTSALLIADTPCSRANTTKLIHFGTRLQSSAMPMQVRGEGATSSISAVISPVPRESSLARDAG